MIVLLYRWSSDEMFLIGSDSRFQETEYLEISSIRDTRTGKHAKTPKEGKLRDSVNIGAKVSDSKKRLASDFLKFCLL